MKILSFMKIELKVLSREPVSLFFMIVLPIILTMVFGGAFGDSPTQYGSDIMGIDTVIPINIVFLLTNVGLMGIPITITELKISEVLKRYVTYPISYREYFLALMLTFTLVSVISSLLFTSVGFVYYQAKWFMGIVDTILYILIYALIIYIFYSIGYLLSMWIKNPRTASILTSAFFMGMVFTSGVAVPVDSLPWYVQKIAFFLPMYHCIEALKLTWLGVYNWGNIGSHLIYMVSIGVVLTVLLGKVRVKWD